MHILPTTAGVVLSACGVGLLILDVRSGVSTWEAVFYQGFGFLCGVSVFAVVTRSMRVPRASGSSTATCVSVLLVVPHLGASAFSVGRPLLGEILRLVGVILVGTAIIWRAAVRRLQTVPGTTDAIIVLIPACVIVIVEMLLQRTAGAIALAVSTAAMVVIAGYSQRYAVLILLVPVLLVGWQLQSRAITRAYARSNLQNTVAVVQDVQAVPFIDWLISGSPYRQRRWFWLFMLPPDLARNVTLIKIAGVAGLAGAAVVAGMFGLLAWHGVRKVRKAETLAERVMVAGMTVALVTPVPLQLIGALLLVSARAGGPLPFVGYGPGQLVLNWIMLAYLARQESSKRVEHQPVLVTL